MLTTSSSSESACGAWRSTAAETRDGRSSAGCAAASGRQPATSAMATDRNVWGRIVGSVMVRRWRPDCPLAGLALMMVAAASCRQATQESPSAPAAASSAAASTTAAQNVGSAVCAGCHAAEAAAWRPSQHARAMMPASGTSVLAKFTGSFRYNGISLDLQPQGRRLRRLDGRSGRKDSRLSRGLHVRRRAAAAVPRAVSGWTIPGAPDGLGQPCDGRGRPALVPPPARRACGLARRPPLDGPAGNWNYMCAECHSTDLEKRYTSASDIYQTRWTDMNVACEACHGPGSKHVEWAGRPPHERSAEGSRLLDEGRLGRRLADAGGRVDREADSPPHLTRRLKRARAVTRAAARCGRSIDSAIRWRQSHRVSWLDDGLYFADGQQQDEVYNYGSFLQSKMYAAGVTCSNCHNPHSGVLGCRATRSARNAICPRSTISRRITSTRPAAPARPACRATCRRRTYMVIDGRRDHAFKVPRPDESVTYGVPNACTGCHSGKTAAWAAAAVARWYPAAASRPSWTGVIAQRTGEPSDERRAARATRAGSGDASDRPRDGRVVSREPAGNGGRDSPCRRRSRSDGASCGRECADRRCSRATGWRSACR